MKDQITIPPDNTDRDVAKQKFKITNWPIYNKALINRGFLTFWLDNETIQSRALSRRLTGQSGQPQQMGLTIPDSVTMN